MANLKLIDIKKSYGKTEVIHGLDLEVLDGEFCVLVGPSGCGKSTLLRMIAGLEAITEGSISINDEIVNDISAAKRGLAMVFQSYALYPHMTVRQNLAFGLENLKLDKADIEQRINKAANQLRMEEYLKRRPGQLSGGQRQRVAIGRAIVREPSIYLFDEPLSNLDAALRAETRVEISKLHKQIKTNMIYVTHDQVEAMTLADRIVIIKLRNIEHVGSPDEIYTNPSIPSSSSTKIPKFVKFLTIPECLEPTGYFLVISVQGSELNCLIPRDIFLSSLSNVKTIASTSSPTFTKSCAERK